MLEDLRPLQPLLKFNSLTQKINRNSSCNYNQDDIFAVRRSPKLTLFCLIYLLNNKSMQAKMTMREDEKIR